MHGFQLSVILFDVINDRHSEAGARRQRENTDNFRREKNFYSNPLKNITILTMKLKCEKHALTN